jgi:hypothetical protein
MIKIAITLFDVRVVGGEPSLKGGSELTAEWTAAASLIVEKGGYVGDDLIHAIFPCLMVMTKLFP